MKKRVLITIIIRFLKAISPVLREGIEFAVKQLYEKAKKTEVIDDDLLIEALAELLDVELD